MKNLLLNIIVIILVQSKIFSNDVFAIDTDNDSIEDNIDNCINIPNIEQRDSDEDGFGDRCDGDFDNTCFVNTVDLAIIRFYLESSYSSGDLNGDGEIDMLDFGNFKQLYTKSLSNQSGIATCAP